MWKTKTKYNQTFIPNFKKADFNNLGPLVNRIPLQKKLMEKDGREDLGKERVEAFCRGNVEEFTHILIGSKMRKAEEFSVVTGKGKKKKERMRGTVHKGRILIPKQ